MIFPNANHPVIAVHPDGAIDRSPNLTNCAIFPGSFNPLHRGHQELHRVASEVLDCRVVYEISIANVAKAALTPEVVERRLQQFENDTVVLTKASKFTDKAALFPKCPFVVGFDTAERILDVRFYNNDLGALLAALRTFQSQRHRFLVGGRLSEVNAGAQFATARNLKIPNGFETLFEELSDQAFREDISSTELRRRGVE